MAFRTTKFDDFTNGVDAVIEWEPEEGGAVVPRLAVDFTTSMSKETVKAKLRSLRSGAKVKYFRSQVQFAGDQPLEMSLYVPKVILGLDSRFVADLAADAAERVRTKSLRAVAGETARSIQTVDPRAFAEHPVQMLLLRQAKVQLDQQMLDFAVRLREDSRVMRSRPMRPLEQARSVDQIVSLLSHLSPDVVTNALGDKLAARWFGLHSVRTHVIERLTPLLGTNEDRDARRIAGKSNTHQLLTYFK